MKQTTYLLIILIVILSSCSPKCETPVDYFPFKTEKSDFWGMMRPDGDILFDSRFMYCPSISSRGVFMAREENGLLSFYTAKSNPQKIGNDYYTAAKLFLYSDYTPVRKEGETFFSIIDKKGITHAVLPDNVIDVGFFANGLAPFVIDSIETRMGYIATNGEVKIPAHYIVATNFVCGVALVSYQENDALHIAIISPTGKTIHTFDKALQPMAWEFSDGMLPVINPKGEIGFIDTSGKIVIEPSSEWLPIQPRNNFNLPYTFKDGRSIYCDGKAYGLIDKKGNIVVEAQYENIYLGEGGLFAAENAAHQWGCIDKDGDIIIPFKYLTGEIRPSITPHTIVIQNESGKYKLIDHTGETISHLPFSQYQSKYYNL